jgi:hypothetical protein
MAKAVRGEDGARRLALGPARLRACSGPREARSGDGYRPSTGRAWASACSGVISRPWASRACCWIFWTSSAFRTARRPAAVAGRLKLLGHRLTLPLVPARRNPDRDVGLPIEEITEKLDDSRVAGERLDGFRRLPFVDTEKLIRIGWVPAEAGHTTVSIQGNASQVVLRVPGDVAAAITVEDTGASIEVELASFPYAGERTFRSLNYDAAANRVDVYAEACVRLPQVLKGSGS